jgi:shikimate kinase
VTRERNVILTGFMGTGKSAVGKQLAARLGRKFVDTDVLIEREEGEPITRIFVEKGEPYFRELEKQVIACVCQEKGLVLATGGGAMLNEANVAQLKDSGTVICLTAAPEVILKRVRGNEDRPLLQSGDPLAKIHNLLAARVEAYAKADVTVDTSRLTVDEVVEAVLAALGKDLET